MDGKLAVFLAPLIVLCSCTSLDPHRTVLPKPAEPPDCSPAQDGSVHPQCGARIIERADTYDLHFVEFDDQGRPYTEPAGAGDAPKQVQKFLDAVETSTTGIGRNEHVSVVVFVHGWLHSAHTNDQNLKDFRQLLGQLARIEEIGPCKRKVIGLYVGWRGAGTRLARHPVETPTFWSRKNAAEQIATGSFQQVLSGLKAIQANARDKIYQLPPAPPPPPGVTRPPEVDCTSPLKTTYVGHSFGGLIVLASLSQDLIRGLMRDRHNLSGGAARNTDAPRSVDELVILINPAVESARFDALFRAASATEYPEYRAPRLVAITSTADWPTRRMFPLGRLLNTTTKRYPKSDLAGRTAARATVGHDHSYLTRTLRTWDTKSHGEPSTALAYCKDWHAAAPNFFSRAEVEMKMAAEHFAKTGGVFDARDSIHWPRVFCSSRSGPDTTGLLVMNHASKGPDENSPVWNIQTQPPILDSHTDITNVRLLQFLRQIYIDTMFFN